MAKGRKNFDVVETRETAKVKLKDNGRLYFAILISLLIIMLSIQTVNLYQKERSYKKTQAALKEELEEQQEKSDQLVEYEQQTQSDEYIEETAREKLGMAYANEIVFREK